YPEQAVPFTKWPRSIMCEDSQLLTQSGILQCDLFVANQNKLPQLDRLAPSIVHPACEARHCSPDLRQREHGSIQIAAVLQSVFYYPDVPRPSDMYPVPPNKTRPLAVTTTRT